MHKLSGLRAAFDKLRQAKSAKSAAAAGKVRGQPHLGSRALYRIKLWIFKKSCAAQPSSMHEAAPCCLWRKTILLPLTASRCREVGAQGGAVSWKCRAGTGMELGKAGRYPPPPSLPTHPPPPLPACCRSAVQHALVSRAGVASWCCTAGTRF